VSFATRLRLRSTALLLPMLLSLSGAAGPAAGQGAHPAPEKPRPLHERLEMAAAAAIVQVERVGHGRIDLRSRDVLLGDLPDRFQVKRSPSQPPPLAPGDLALVFLRGSRTPYLLVDEPRETIRLADDAMADRWRDAASQTLALRGDPDGLTRLYLEWVDEGPDSLRELGMFGVVELGDGAKARFERMGPGRAAVALDPARPESARRMSALLALRSKPGTAAMLAGMKQQPIESDLLSLVLRAAAYYQVDGSDAAFRDALSDPDPKVRLAGLRVLPSSTGAISEATRAEAQRLAREDPDPKVRETAERVTRQQQPRKARGAPAPGS